MGGSACSCGKLQAKQTIIRASEVLPTARIVAASRLLGKGWRERLRGDRRFVLPGAWQGVQPAVSAYIQMSLVESPPGKRISCARTGPSGSAPKSTMKSWSSFNPPDFVSQSNFNK